MYQFLTKYGTMTAFSLGLLITLIFLAIAINGAEEFNLLADEERAETTIFNFGLMAVLVLIVVCILVSLGFGLRFLITHPKQAVRFGIGFGALVVLFIVLYSVSSIETTGRIAQKAKDYGVGDTASRIISGGLLTVLALAGLAVVSFVVAEIRNIFK
jgi:hypothetical protein